MLGKDLRKNTDRFRSKIGVFIAKTKINPNLFTLGAILMATISAFFISRQDFLLGLIFTLLAYIWDAFDGSVARAQNKATKFGNYLDALVDKYVEIVILFGFALAGFQIEAFFVITGSLILSYAKPRTAMVVQIDNHDWPAIGERLDRLVLLSLLNLIYIFIQTMQIGELKINIMSIGLVLIGIIVYIGSVQRILYAKGLIEKGSAKK